MATLAVSVLCPFAAVAAGAPNTAAPPVSGGWGHVTSSYIGSYRVVPVAGSVPTQSVVSPPEGVFSQVVRTAAALGAGNGTVSSGSLTTFLRKVKTGEPLSPSGILSLFGPSGTQVLYLTDLDLHGTRRVATVNGGSFLGVPIGSLSATPGTGHRLQAVIKASGLGTVRVALVGFRPTPSS